MSFCTRGKTDYLWLCILGGWELHLDFVRGCGL